MATYGRGQMLGSGINPESFKLDYSGMANAAATQARGVANLGASIGGAISEVGDYFKKQKEDEQKVQKSLSVAKAIGDLIPGLQPTIQGSLNILNDKEIPLSQRTAEANAITDILNLAISEVRNRQDFGLRERALGIQEAEALARNAPKPVVYNFESVEIPAEYGGKSGVLRADKDLSSGIIRTADGKLYRNEEDAKLQRNPIVQGDIDAGLNTGIPTSASEAERKSILINNALEIPNANDTVEADPSLLTDFIPPPDGVPVATETPAPVGAPTMTGTPVIDALPPGFTPTQAESAETFRAATPEEAAEYGAVAGQINEQTKRFYPISLPTGMTVESDGQGGIKVVQGAGVGGKDEKAEAERKKQQSSFVDEFTKTAAETIKLLPNLPDNPVGAKFGAVLGEILPGTEQGRVVSRLNTIKANLALDKINQMRAASPTGGAAGTMTVQEWPLFMQEFGSLDAAENKQDLEARLKNASVKLFNRVNGTPEERQSALEKGIITKEQNEIVQKQYDGMLSTLGISTPKSPTSSGVKLLPNEQDLIDKYKTK